MDTKIKKIVAREGLILFGIILFGSIIIKTAPYLKPGFSYLEFRLFKLGYALKFYGYPFYLLIRFIIWAIKALKTK